MSLETEPEGVINRSLTFWKKIQDCWACTMLPHASAATLACLTTQEHKRLRVRPSINLAASPSRMCVVACLQQ